MKKSMDVSIVILVLTCLAAFAAFFANREDSNQKDRIEDLGKINKDLGKKINTLSTLNHNIAAETEKIVSQNTTLTQQNIELTTKTKDLISEVQDLVKILNVKTDQEFTVTGKFIFDYPSTTFENTVTVDMGGSPAAYKLSNVNQKATPLWLVENNAISFGVKDNQLVMAVKVYDIEGNLIVDVENNNWRINKNLVSKFNYDKRGVEVFDNKGRIVLSVNIVPNKNTIYIQGIFVDGMTGMVAVFSPTMMSISTGTVDQRNKDISSILLQDPIKQLFEYKGEKWHGLRKVN